MKLSSALLLCLLLFSCSKEEIPEPTTTTSSLYFPPLNSEVWEKTNPETLNWNASATDELYDFLSQNDTRAFLLLKDGKIVLEQYWGNTLQGNSSFTQNSSWYWASAGKTLTAFLTGIAQEKGYLQIEDPTTNYLGKGWTELPSEKEALIKIKHQLSMTTGLDYNVDNPNCTLASCLQYRADAGNQWFYHNAPYTLLSQVIGQATGQSYNQFTGQNLSDKIGMSGAWITSGDNTIYWSTPRSAARFALLLLNEGTWQEEMILADKAYFEQMTSPSQNLNSAYGYCTWLNGQSSIIYPGLPTSFNATLSEHAPSDLFAALGKNGQFIDVVPSLNLIMIRMGEAPDNSLVPTIFHDEIWEKLNAVIGR